MIDPIPVPESGEIALPNGCTLYWKLDPSVNCREYVSDEIGGGVTVWHTALVDSETLLAAIVQEARLRKMESVNAMIEIRRQAEAVDIFQWEEEGGRSAATVR